MRSAKLDLAKPIISLGLETCIIPWKIQWYTSQMFRENRSMLMKLSLFDFAVIAAYFIAVLGVGYWLKDKMKTSGDFLLSNRSFSHWITGIAFMSANLGALEVMGHTANGAKYGMRTNHWYWLAIPPMVFLGLFMVRYYYTNGVRSVPEYLRMRYDHRAHVMKIGRAHV
jgi:SSS family solute:Na+ symporter